MLFKPILTCSAQASLNIGVFKMMKCLEYGKYRKIRVWEGELPNVLYSPAEIKKTSFPVSFKSINKNIKIGIEIASVVGPRTLYGLLGATFDSSDAGILKFEVCSSFGHEALLEDSLITNHSIDLIHVGLLNEYADAVNESIASSESTLEKIGSGKIVFNHAAYGDIGSSPSIFRKLTDVILKYIGMNIFDISEQDLNLIMPEKWA
jgi:hypothetical protein